MSVPAEHFPLKRRDGADKKLRALNANEFVFAVVGPIGSGTSFVAATLNSVLSGAPYKMEVQIIKASDCIGNWAVKAGKPIVQGKAHEKVTALQNAGDDMRVADPAAVAIEIISAIKHKRAAANPAEGIPQIGAVDTQIKRAYIVDSLKHPAEVELLRAIYQESFILVGVVCEENVRKERLREKCKNAGDEEIALMMKRDEDGESKYGQKVTDTFHRADFFVDNSPNRFEDKENKVPNKFWSVVDNLGRLIDLITFTKIIRPTASETGMFHAYGAKMRSACMSRQVGAALLDGTGNILSTGTNEVPKAGGGVYGVSFSETEATINDDRCSVTRKYCSSNRWQNAIIDQVIEAIPQLQTVENKESLRAQLKKTPIGRILEFSRAVHAEMDALLSAARTGATTVGTRLFVTTYPCHYCARHIVSAGVDEVQYIEPYPKSKALSLHGDAIADSPAGWNPPSLMNSSGTKSAKVLFRPFTGVAPRMYRQVFLKDRPLKNDAGEYWIGESDAARGLMRVSYKEVEDILLKGEGDE